MQEVSGSIPLTSTKFSGLGGARFKYEKQYPEGLVPFV